MTDILEERAVWTTAYVDNLADSAFLYIQPGGTQDGEGKTTPRSNRHFPYKDDQGKIDLPHLRNALARIPQSNIPPDVKNEITKKAQRILADASAGEQQVSMPRDGLVRAVFPAELELRAAADGGATMVGHFAVFDTFTEINSAYEGNFLERIAPGAFDKTFSEQTPKVLFNHGSDPQIGDKVLGAVTSLESDATGARYEVDLFDTSYNRDLIPGLKAGAYGASFRFKVMREDINKDAKRTVDNPKGLPERTITEARVMEFGPVTFPAYAEATAGIRSMTDRFREVRVDAEDLGTLACAISAVTDYIADQDEPDDQKNIPVAEGILKTLGDLVAVEVAETEPVETEDEGEMNAAAPDGEQRETIPESQLVAVSAAPSHPETRRDTQPPTPEPKMEARKMEELLARIDEITREQKEIHEQYRNQLLDPETQDRWDGLVKEKDDLLARVKAQKERDDYIGRQVADSANVEVTVPRNTDYAGLANNVRGKDRAPENVFALEEYHSRASSQEGLMRLYTDGAKRAVENLELNDPRADENKAKTNLDRVLSRDTEYSETAQYVLRHAAPAYRRAFGKMLQQAPLSQEEQRALGIGSQGGQFPVPIQIDPTVTLVSNGYINPLRQIARNVTMTGYEWRGVSTTGITAHYGAEGAVAADDSPTLLQPTIDAERAWTFVPYSFEAGQDWAGLEEELGVTIADAKDLLEATQFLTGAGHASSAPKGVLRSTSTVQGTALNTNAGTVFTVQHVYELETALPPRFRPNAEWVMNKAVVQRIRQFDTAGGAALWTGFGPAPLQAGMPNQLLGYPVHELTTMSTAIPTTSGSTWGLFGDFSKFIIADRIGMSVQVIPQIFNGNTAGGMAYPTGQQGLYAFWRNSSDVMSSNAFRAGTQS